MRVHLIYVMIEILRRIWFVFEHKRNMFDICLLREYYHIGSHVPLTIKIKLNSKKGRLNILIF